MLRGELYRWADDPRLRADHERADALLARYNATGATDADERHRILVELLGSVGEGVAIRPPLFMDYGYQTSIGGGTFINFNCVILDVARVTIGADVQVGPNVQILTPTHPLNPDVRRSGLEAAEPITIEDNVWLGGGVIVCPGVTIGRDSVVGAGAVVDEGRPCRLAGGREPRQGHPGPRRSRLVSADHTTRKCIDGEPAYHPARSWGRPVSVTQRRMGLGRSLDRSTQLRRCVPHAGAGQRRRADARPLRPRR